MIPKPEVRVFSYLRVSTAQQIEKDGYPRQREAIDALCKRKGWWCVREFVEQQSGSDSMLDRPKLLEAIELCGGNLGVKTIVVERVDRVGRGLIVSELFYAECVKRGIEVYAADSEIELTNGEGDPTRTLIRQILGAFAEWSKSELCKKLQNGRRRKAAATGKPCGGRRLYGDAPEEKFVVDLIWDMKINGHLSYQQIADRLELDQFKNPQGRVKWSRYTVRDIVKRHPYNGPHS